MHSALSAEESLFHAARALQSASERLAFLDQACDDDAALRQRVERAAQPKRKTPDHIRLEAEELLSIPSPK